MRVGWLGALSVTAWIPTSAFAGCAVGSACRGDYGWAVAFLAACVVATVVTTVSMDEVFR